MTGSRSARVIVIGAGIGGLTTAALLAQAGYDVTVLEGGRYAGGCAGTYYHQGYRFDAGATVAGGFQANGPHTLVGEKLGVTWPVHPSEPAWVVHLPDRQLTRSRDNADVLAHFPHSQRFWAEQARVADLVWSLAAEGLPWPPSNAAELAQLARTGLTHLPHDLRLVPFAFSSTHRWMRRYGLTDDAAFVRFVDAQLLISAQTTSPRANALYSAAALDLIRQGVYHVQGGMGRLADTLAARLTALGGRVRYRQRVTKIQVEHGRATGVYVQQGRRSSKRTFLPCDFLVANLTPWSLNRLLGEASPQRLRREARNRKPGWGAFVLYLGVEAGKLPPDMTDHHQIITDMHGPLAEGRSIFVSLSPAWDASRAPEGHRAVTITTHTAVQPWWDLLKKDRDAYAARKQAYTERILNAIEQHLPGFRRSVVHTLPGTPTTYDFYTGRHLGMVGGFPQTSLLRARGPRTGIVNLRLVGDSIFPGQSTAAVTLGAMRVARDVQQNQPRRLPGAVDRRQSVKATQP